MRMSDTRTGRDVEELGEYVNDCCLIELTLSEDRMFPRCPQCLHLCIWESMDLPVPKAA